MRVRGGAGAGVAAGGSGAVGLFSEGRSSGDSGWIVERAFDGRPGGDCMGCGSAPDDSGFYDGEECGAECAGGDSLQSRIWGIEFSSEFECGYGLAGTGAGEKDGGAGVDRSGYVAYGNAECAAGTFEDGRCAGAGSFDQRADAGGSQRKEKQKAASAGGARWIRRSGRVVEGDCRSHGRARVVPGECEGV